MLLEGNINLSIELYLPSPVNSVFTILNSTTGISGYTNGARFVFGTNSLDDGEEFFIQALSFRQRFVIDYDAGGGKQVQLIVVPEPRSVVSLLGGFAMLAGLQRFRRRKS